MLKRTKNPGKTRKYTFNTAHPLSRCLIELDKILMKQAIDKVGEPEKIKIVARSR